MIIWRGFGIAIVFIFGLMYLLVNWVFGKYIDDFPLHYSLTFFLTALVWTATLVRGQTNKRLLREAEEQLQRPELLDEKTRRTAELRIKARKAATILDESDLFFIPARWWHYILGAAGIAFLCVHLFFLT